MRLPRHSLPRVVPIDSSWLWAGLVGAGILLLAWQISAPPPEILFSDFYQAYYATGERMLHAGPVATWPLRETCTEGFVNIPILGYLFVPFALMSKPTAAWTFFSLGVAAVATAYVLVTRLCSPEAKCGPLLLFLFLVNGPMIHSFREGNITHLLFLFIIVALLLWRAGSDYAAGLLLGFCAALKLPLLIFGVYFALRRRWWIVAGGATTLALIAGLSLAVFGATLNIGWYDYCVSPFIGRIMPGFNDQSIDSFLFRLFDGQAHLHVWYLIEPTRTFKFVRTLALVAMSVGALLPLWRAKRFGTTTAVAGTLAQYDLLGFVLVLNLALVVSPLSWSHYYLFLLLPWGLYIGDRLPLPDDAVTKWLMIGGMVLASAPVLMLPKDLGPLAPLTSRTLVSSIFLGGMLTLAALVRGAWWATRPQDVREKSPGLWLAAAVRLAKPSDRGCLSPPEVLTRNIAIFFIVNAGAINLILWFATPSGLGHTVLYDTWNFLLGHSGDDSWSPMAIALKYFEHEYFRPPYTAPIYTELALHRGEKFQYPPSSLFFFSGMRTIDALVFGDALAKTVVSWISVVVTAIASAILFEKRLRLACHSACHDNLGGLRMVLVVGSALTFYPVVKAFSLGQIQAWINGLFALALLLWATNRKAWAGLAIGIVALIKPHFGIPLAWAVLRREWRFFIAGTATVVLGLALSLHVFGWDNHVDYLRLLSYISERGEAYYPNQSVNGLLNRFMSIADPVQYNNLNWLSGHFPPFTPWIYAATVASSAIILALALLRPRQRDDADGTFDFCTIAVSCTLASPIAWEHHYGILFPVFAVLTASAVSASWRLAWLAVSFVFASNYFPVTKLLAYTPLNFVQSYLFASALIVLTLLHLRISLTQPAQIKSGSQIKVLTAADG